jgi:hypothetical protein
LTDVADLDANVLNSFEPCDSSMGLSGALNIAYYRGLCFAIVKAKPIASHCLRRAEQALVVRPKLRTGSQPNRGEQMDVDITNAAPEQRVTIDEFEDFCVRGDDTSGKL